MATQHMKGNAVIKKNLKFAATLLALSTLAACGGGGGSTSPASSTASGPVTAPVSTVVISAPATTYAAGSEELSAFNRLNAERSQCGFGVLAQNAVLDKAALAHANWQVAINTQGHYESAGTPYFTGVTPLDRVLAAGYSATNQGVTEEIGGSQSNVKVGMGENLMRGLLNAPYHAAQLLAGFRDVGFSFRNTADLGITTWQREVLQVSPAFKTSDGFQLLGPNDVATYPCEGATGVNPNLQNETPNPVPGRDLFVNPLGTSVMVYLREGNTITVTSATMTNLATGAPVTLRPPLSAKNDPNITNGISYFRSNQAVVTADAALPPLTRFQVTLAGTNNGVAFSRSFIFTTGKTQI